ncbi:hypothetical protein [Variovorax sp. PAMC 28711]|uniref:hypothetical protein n=1 Tax=Variovorax sp. PAMC 28711 TaxID=1795631 RepID=UPI00078CBDCC|nr:hypothetical protein [Variovorax sp. PAMC 28711]AMM22999.1 hypothetical protein AX767_00340 [Variovorax sp. PAMC 28711]
MSDTVTLPGTGAVIATDDVGGVQFQRIKIAVGADGVAADASAAAPLPVGGIRRDADTAYAADLAAHPLLFNDGGRLKVSVTPADIASTAGNITTNGGVVALQVKRLSNLSISMVAAALVGHNVTFEASNNSTTGSDGTWYGVQVVRSNANTVETASGVLAATPAYMWQVNVSDYAWFRVRATAHTSGTAAYILNPSSYVSEPIPAIQVSATQPVSGTVAVTALPAGTNLIGNTGVAAATHTDKSGTITAGGTAQTPFAINAARRGFLIQNNSAGDLWFNTLATAVQSQPSIKLPAGGYYESPYGGCPTTAISIIGATTAQAFSAREW